MNDIIRCAHFQHVIKDLLKDVWMNIRYSLDIMLCLTKSILVDNFKLCNPSVKS